MKNLILLALLLVAGVSASIAQNTWFVSVSGHVYQDSTMTGVPNYLVMATVTGSGMVQTITMSTNNQGFYSGVVNGIASGQLEVFAPDCNGQMISYSTPFTPDNNVFQFNFWICGGSPTWCKAAYAYQVNPGFTAPVVAFTDLSTGNPTSWLWDFGDGSYSTEQNPVHEYTMQGTYNVCLTISSPDGSCQDIYCDVVYTNAVFPDCYNWFWYNQYNNYDFEFFAETIPQATEFLWDFGDGTTGTGQTVTHSYQPNTGDVFIVTLHSWVLDPATGDSCYSHSAEKVFIYGFPNDCYNWFWYMPQPGGAVEFYGDAYPTAESWFWDFGDGTTGTGQNVIHQYDPAAGDLVIVTLTTTSYTANGEMCTATSTQEVYLGNQPGDCFNFFWYEETGNNTINLYGESWPAPANLYQWTFPDGTTQYGQQVSYSYDPNMVNGFEVCLETYIWMNTMDSCYAQSCQFVFVGGGGWSEISGMIYAGDNPADQAFAMLYQVTPAGIELFDYQFAEPYTGKYSFYFAPPGEYYVTAFLSPSSAYFNQYFPTYYGDALYWYEATVINPDTAGLFYDIHLIPASGGGNGECSITGNITIESKGDPGSNLQVVLMNEDNQPMAFVNSDDEGNFAFGNLGFGVYHVKVEMPGAECEIATAELTANSQHAVVNFVIEGTQIFLGMNEQDDSVKIFSIFPNPADKEININLYVEENEVITISITDILGKEVISTGRELMQGNQTLELPVAELREGIYNLTLRRSSGERSSMKFVK